MENKIKYELKSSIIKVSLDVFERGLTVGTWGNISVIDRSCNLIYITPSGMDYGKITENDIVVLDLEEKIVEGARKPSVETPMHVAVYKARQDVNSVIHYHPVYSTVLSITNTEIPGISEDFVQIVGDKVICSKYALPSTRELALNVVKGLGKRNAVLMPNHGALCTGKDIEDAFKVCTVLEKTAKIFILSKIVGTYNLISDEDIKIMQAAIKNYGQK